MVLLGRVGVSYERGTPVGPAQAPRTSQGAAQVALQGYLADKKAPTPLETP